MLPHAPHIIAAGLCMSYAWFRTSLAAGGYRLVWGGGPVGET